MITRRPTRAAGPLGAVQFLTLVPVRTSVAPDLAASVPWFPVVGAVIGALLGAVAAGLAQLVAPLVAAAVAVIAGVALTGAFHEDGLADTADALGGWTPERRREILRDPRHGTYGVAAMVGSIVIRVACVASLGPAAAFAGLTAAHTLGRSAAVTVMATAQPVTSPGLGADYMRTLRRPTAVVGAAVGLLVRAVATGWWAAPLAVVAGLAGAGVALLARAAFGGVSGDILGGVEQLAECAVLIVVSGLATRHTLWWT